MSAIPCGLAAIAQTRPLVEEVKESLGVTETAAHAVVVSCDPFWRRDMIRECCDRLARRERADLARRIQPYDLEEDEEALA